MTKVELIDKERLLKEFAGDEEILAELCSVFEAELPKMLKAVETAIHAGEMKALERSAHTLKGAVANFQAHVVKEAAFTLEKQGRESNAQNVEENFQNLKNLLVSLKHELDTLIGRGS